MNYLIIYLAGVIIFPLLIPPADPSEFSDVASIWLVAFLWPFMALLLFSIFLLLFAAFIVFSIVYVLLRIFNTI